MHLNKINPYIVFLSIRADFSNDTVLDKNLRVYRKVYEIFTQRL